MYRQFVSSRCTCQKDEEKKGNFKLESIQNVYLTRISKNLILQMKEKFNEETIYKL